MIAQAIASKVPFSWVAADSVYGVGDIEMALKRAAKGYVPCVPHLPPRDCGTTMEAGRVGSRKHEAAARSARFATRSCGRLPADTRCRAQQ